MTDHSKFAGISPEGLLKELGVSAAPIDLDAIATSLGIDISREFFFEKDHSGEIAVNEGTVACWINPFDPPNRQRFTLAHEIGHYVNDIAEHLARDEAAPEFIDGSESLRRDGRQHPSEYRANDFAARLLMPKHLVIEEGKRFIQKEQERTGKKTVSKDIFYDLMAKKFEVSKQAMEIRLDSLGLVPMSR